MVHHWTCSGRDCRAVKNALNMHTLKDMEEK